MPNPPSSSPGSAPCRLEWRPSRQLLLALALLVPLACASLWLSALPGALAGLLSPVLLLAGATRWRWLAHRPRRRLQIHPPGRPSCVDGLPVADLRVHWRGPLARVSWRRGPGRRHAVLFWPDTLPAPRRRELRLATCHRAVSSSAPGMAP